jgi:hypothetical protein
MRALAACTLLGKAGKREWMSIGCAGKKLKKRRICLLCFHRRDRLNKN